MQESRPGFDEDAIRRIVALAEQQKAVERREWTPQSILARLDQAIIGNRKYKESLALCIADFLGPNELRNHLLVVGPSGSGKTYLLEQCVPDFGISSLFIDASALVPSGYKGYTIPEALDLFFRSSPDASQRCLIVLDEFDKLSPLANGGDTFKSHSLQSELLALIQGKKEGAIDTRHTLWLFAGAFAFTDEMKQAVPRLRKTDLLRYGFKNELLGRITTMTMTERPTVEEVVRQVVSDRAIVSLLSDLKSAGYDITFTDDAVLELALAAQNPSFGMRVVPSLVMDIKKRVIFRDTGSPFVISGTLVKELLQA